MKLQHVDDAMALVTGAMAIRHSRDENPGAPVASESIERMIDIMGPGVPVNSMLTTGWLAYLVAMLVDQLAEARDVDPDELWQQMALVAATTDFPPRP